VAANPASSAMSSPTQTARQCVALNRIGRLSARITTHATKKTQHPVNTTSPTRRRRACLGSIIGCGNSIRASSRASSRRSSAGIRRSSPSSITLPFCPPPRQPPSNPPASPRTRPPPPRSAPPRIPSRAATPASHPAPHPARATDNLMDILDLIDTKCTASRTRY